MKRTFLSLVAGLSTIVPTAIWADEAVPVRERIPASNREALRDGFTTRDTRHNMIENKIQDARPAVDEWRYVKHNGRWWYWPRDQSWMHYNAKAWVPQCVKAVPRPAATIRTEPGPTRMRVNRVPPPTAARTPVRAAPPPTGIPSRAEFRGPDENQLDLDPAGLTPTIHNQTIEDAQVGGQAYGNPSVGGKPGRGGSINGTLDKGAAGPSVAPPP